MGEWVWVGRWVWVCGRVLSTVDNTDTDTITLQPIDSADLSTLSQNDTRKG